MTEQQLQKKIEEGKKKRHPNLGGARPGAGRKRKMEEHEIIERLSPMANTAFKVLQQKIEEGDMKAIQIFCNYFIGLPTQKIESKIEGQLNQVSVEVVKPVFNTEEVTQN